MHKIRLHNNHGKIYGFMVNTDRTDKVDMFHQKLKTC